MAFSHRGKGQEDKMRRTGHVGTLVASVALLLVGPAHSGSAAHVVIDAPEGTCLSSVELPCSASSGQVYDGTLLGGGGPNDTEENVEAVLAHVLGPGVDVTQVKGDLTQDSVEVDLSPDVVTGRRAFSWSYTGSERLVYLTVKASNGFAIFGIATLGSGTVDIEPLLGHDVAHVRLWTSTGSISRPVTPSALHGKGEFLGNTRLGKISGGKVPCVHIETLAPAQCKFGKASGDWIETLDGPFAVAGQQVSIGGRQGGEYVVGAQVNTDGSVPALGLSGHDGAGVATAQTLEAHSILETRLASTNASGEPLQNYATLEVCSTDNPDAAAHLASPYTADQVTLTRVMDGGIECYQGLGAGLNDRYGTERDVAGFYFGPQHEYWDDGCACLILAAKRPGTTGYYPGKVAPKTQTVWRPVARYVTIAN